jgi:hypothetical protein
MGELLARFAIFQSSKSSLFNGSAEPQWGWKYKGSTSPATRTTNRFHSQWNTSAMSASAGGMDATLGPDPAEEE